jgi:hypothetical protein
MSRSFRISVAAALFASAAWASPANFSPLPIDQSFSSAVPAQVQVADFDGDLLLDLAVSLSDVIGDTDSLLWYQNDGTGGFIEFVIDPTIGGLGDNPAFIGIGDFALDALPEIVLATTSRLYVFENHGGGVFARNQIDGGLSAVRDGEIVDMDGDLDPDILFLANNGVYWEENEGIAGFTRRTVHAITVASSGLAAGDIDRDGLTDVVIAPFANPNHQITWYQNLGGGSFAQHTIDTVAGDVTDLVVADMNRNGRLDIVACLENNDVIVYDQFFGLVFNPTTIDNSFSVVPRRLHVIDIDNDTDDDIVVVGGNSSVGEVMYYENGGVMSFTRRGIDATAGNRRGLAIADVHGSALPDLFVAQQFPHRLVEYQNLGLGTGVTTVPRAGLVLHPSRPNPFNPATTIEFDLAESTVVAVEIYRVDGSRVRVLAARPFDAGPHRLGWDGHDDSGARLPSGVYVLRVRAGGDGHAQKITLLR